MASISNVNSNSSVVNVGRTTPVTPGAQTADKSIPVVMATDQTSIPVVEQNKVQSEVALSLLGIPRAEIALGIFADVNTYDVNPSEWSMKPEYYVSGDGVKHLPTEAGALVEASRNKTAVLTSKRFFRYQPGRVSAATFGVKSSVSNKDFAQNPTIRKFGIYDKYDGYYWESRNNGQDDNFTVVRRTQSLQYSPVSPYGVAGQTPLRGEDNLKIESGQESSIDFVTDTQLDDYRIVGLGEREKEVTVGNLENDRKLLTEKRYAVIDAALASVVSAYNTSGGQTTANGKSWTATGAGNYYVDFCNAINAAVGYSVFDANGTGPAQLEAKCKRDLDYWIDNFLLDLEYGGNAHTKWNTTNFAISNGTLSGNANDWEGSEAGVTNVGIFPNITIFEKPIHQAILTQINSGSSLTNLSTAGRTALDALQDTVLLAFNSDNFAPQIPATSDYGSRTSASERLETFFETKRNFWSYYVTTKKAARGAGSLTDGVKYTILNTGSSGQNWNAVAEGGNASPFVGQIFESNGTALVGTGVSVAESIVYDTATTGTSSTSSAGSALQSFDGLTDAQVQEIIANKCQRDVGYVVDGYKNDLVGGGNAETTYNASMFIRGTGLSVYSQKEGTGANATLSEIARHQHLRDIMLRDLVTFGVSTSIVNGNDNSGSFANLATIIIDNFSEENTLTLTTGNKGFPGNLVVMRDGLIHTHGAVFDPSLLKDPKPVLTLVTGTSSYAVNEFKLTEGTVTFGQHVKITWTGTADTLNLDNTGSPKVLSKGEILRVRRVIGPKGNEFTLIKEDYNHRAGQSHTPVTILLADLNNSSTVGDIYIDTVVPFVFPKDYDISSHVGNQHLDNTAFISEIDTTIASLTNNASGYPAPSVGAGAANDPRIFREVAANLDTKAVPKGGMFPLMYATEDNLLSADLENEYVGFINTAIKPTLLNNVDVIRSQIDNVNFFPEYVNWIKNNVKPEYWGVYEYRVPRSRFSHDALDGVSGNADQKSFATKGRRNRVYSDLATGPSGTARPGENYIETEGVPEFQNSLYDYDFTKVTMLKIEFSWYGAVGALFLAYIPVGNGEARWVRVHHLRASNQLKIASLGNATLPITYTTYGGGDTPALGDGEDFLSDYNTASHHIVKYGASYYIDGGDRGTVRLYSHNNDDTVPARGKRTPVLNVPSLANGLNDDTAIPGESVSTISLDVTELYTIGELQTAGSVPTIGQNGVLGGLSTGSEPDVGDFIEITGGSNSIADGVYKVISSNSTTITLGNRFTGVQISAPSDGTVDGTFTHKRLIDPRYYIGAKVKTDSLLDQNVKVIWADDELGNSNPTPKVYLSAPLNSHSGIHLLADRSASVYGIETKKTILSTREQNAVRNRVQVYPTKLSTANLDSATTRLRFKKTPIFQTHIAPNETLNSNDGFTLDADYEINNANTALPVTSGAESYISNGDETYGWFRGRIGSEGVTVFGRLYKEATYYYFQMLESYEGTVTLISGGKFLADKRFQADGTEVAYSNANTKSTYETEGLSSVKIASNTVVPIANTGTNVATLYLKQGTEQFDLDTYFDYNKEYLSFPLTDIADTLYFAVDSDTTSSTTNEISLGVTWEEQ